MKITGTRLLSLLIIVLNFVFGCAAGQDHSQAGSELLARAQQIVNVRASGSPPFRLSEHLRFMGLGRQWIEGDYVLTWAASDEWKDELTLPDYHETRFATQGKVWSLRNLRFTPMDVVKMRPFPNWNSPLAISPHHEK